MAYEEQDYNKRAFEWPVWKSILPYLKPYQKTLLVILTLNLACAAIDILMPLFQRYAIDHFIEARTSSGLISFAAAYAGVVVRLHAGGDGHGARSQARVLCAYADALFFLF